jgi:hypothetical protein
MAPQDARRALANLCAATDRVLFSSSPHDYGEATHVNVRAPEAWAAEFAGHGFFRNLDYDASYIAPWTVLYERRSTEPRDIVREYDRAYWRLHEEARQLRSTVLQLHERLDGAGTASDDRARVIIELQEQLLAMRDLVIGLEAELGQMKGEREYYAAALAASAPAAQQLDRIRSTSAWRVASRFAGPLRRFRRYLRA